jgi:hypothetical protein
VVDEQGHLRHSAYGASRKADLWKPSQVLQIAAIKKGRVVSVTVRVIKDSYSTPACERNHREENSPGFKSVARSDQPSMKPRPEPAAAVKGNNGSSIAYHLIVGSRVCELVTTL